jgi:RND family efflux transporter MFP subunit
MTLLNPTTMNIRGLFLFLVISGIAACGGTDNTEEYPEDLASLKEIQTEKRDQLKQLERELDELERRINEVDTSQVRALPTVGLDTLVRYDFNHYVEVQGTVQSRDVVAATSEIGGRISALFVDEGDRVRAGQIIARTDDATLRAQEAEIESQLSLARELFNRQKRLWEQKIGSEVQYLQAKNNKENLEKRLETLKVNLEKTKVRAPKSGLVDELRLKAGEFASPGLPIATIIDDRRLKVVMEVPENYLGKVNKGDTIILDFPNIDDRRWAIVSLVGSRINPRNRTFSAEALLTADSKGLIRPNMLVTALINDYTQPNAIQVPINMVQQEIGGDNFVYLKGKRSDGQTVAVKQKITVGRVFKGMAVVKEGLEEGQILLLEGARNLREGEPFQALQQ